MRAKELSELVARRGGSGEVNLSPGGYEVRKKGTQRETKKERKEERKI